MNLPFNKQRSNGFTIIELMLAMGFISLLLLAIALLTLHLGTIYNQGITLREVNEAGLTVSEDIQRTIGAAAPFVINASKESNRYITSTEGGRLCVGSHTYAWNYLGNTPSGEMNKYTTPQSAPISLVKVADPGGRLCRAENVYERINPDNANELLAVGDRNLVVYDFKISSPTSVSITAGQTLYAVDFTIGTNGTDIVDATNKTCRPPSESSRSREYCAVNQFSIIVRAGSEAGGR